MSAAPRLVCRRRGPLATALPLVDGQGARIGAVDFERPEDASFSLRGTRHAIERIGAGRWRCREVDGREVGTARRRERQPLELEFTLEGEPPWSLQPASGGGWLTSRFSLQDGTRVRGRVDRRLGLWTNALEADGDPDVPTPALAFALWLVGIHWVGMTRSAAAGRA